MFGNKEVPLKVMSDLFRPVEFSSSDEEDEIFFRPMLESYQPEQVKELILLIATLGPDEYNESDGWIRFWWD